MRRFGLAAVAALILSAAGLVALASRPEPPQVYSCHPEPLQAGASSGDEVLVKFRPGADPAAVSERHAGSIASVIAAIDVYVVTVPPGSADQKVTEFSADPDVVYAEPNATATTQLPPEPSPHTC